MVGGRQRHNGRKALSPAGPEVRIGQGRRHLLDHRLGHQPLAALVPLQAGGQGGEQPPADPLHRRRQRQRLGEGQPPGPPGMGRIDDHRLASGHGRPDPLVQQLLNGTPGPLHRRIAEHLGADRIGGEHHRGWLTGRAEQGRQGPGQGGLAAGRRADQEVAAQSGLGHGTHQNVWHGKVDSWGSAVSSTSCSSSAWAASIRSKGSRWGWL